MSDSSRLHGLQSTRLLCPWDVPGKSTGVGCHYVLRSKALTLFIIAIVPGGLSLQEKIERANQFLKSAIKIITQKTFLEWKEPLPIALLCTSIAPKEQVGLSPYEILYGTFSLYQ